MTAGPPPDGVVGPPDPGASQPHNVLPLDLPESAAPEPAGRPPARSPGLFRFSIEGRRAPGLFVAGWLATVVGVAAAIVGSFAGPTLAGASSFIVGLGVSFAGLLLLGGSQTIERRAAGVAYAGPSPVLVFVATIAAIYLTVVVIATPLDLLRANISGAALSLFGVSLQGLAVIIVLRLLVVGPGALSWREMGLIPDVRLAIRDLAWGALFAVPIVLATAVGVRILVQLLGASPASPLPPTGTSIGLLVNLLAGAVVAPISEELLFRGFATTSWSRMIGPVRAIVRTSLVFALAHAIDQQGATFVEGLAVASVAAAARLPVAFALGWVFVRRRSLWAAIGLHATFNAILIVVAETALRG
ncbi:MAG: type II CAAX endopeptidase family protein [Candidatus Limnocylindrales bacterium]